MIFEVNLTITNTLFHCPFLHLRPQLECWDHSNIKMYEEHLWWLFFLTPVACNPRNNQMPKKNTKHSGATSFASFFQWHLLHQVRSLPPCCKSIMDSWLTVQNDIMVACHCEDWNDWIVSKLFVILLLFLLLFLFFFPLVRLLSLFSLCSSSLMMVVMAAVVIVALC